jgi:hypothetical protein
MIDIGAYPGTPEMDVYHAWLKNRYHAPSDDVNQPIDLEAEAKYEEVIRRLLISVANDDRRPEWKANSFFKRYAQ